MKADYRVQEDVVEELAVDPAVEASGIAIAVKGGVVTLTGTVPSYAMKLAAEQAAMRVGGVKAVAVNLQVDLPEVHQRTDADIAAAALHALEADVTLPHDRLSLIVENGCIRLTGQVDWPYQRTHAHRAVAHLAGVRAVDDRITIAPRPSAENVKESIRRALQRAAVQDAAKIDVEVKEDLVVLRGPVQSLAESRAVADSAFALPGIHRVQNLTYVAE